MSGFTKLSGKISDFSYRFIRILSLLFTGILFLCGFLRTCYALNMETQEVLSTWDSPLWNLSGMALFLFLFAAITRFAGRRPVLFKRVLFVLTALWIVGVGAVLIVFGKTVPAADAWSVYDIASSLASGNTSVIHPTDSYLSYYPQQIGLTAFFEALIRLWKLFGVSLPAYHFIKIIYVFLAVVILFFQYRTVHLLFGNDRADCIFLLLAGANLPFLMYTSFVYGEIPSLAALSIGIYCFLRLFRRHGRSALGSGALAVLFFTLSVLLRKNSLILLIAVVLVSIFSWLKTHRHSLLAFAALCTLCAVSILPITQKCYELRAGNTLSTGVPASSYFAMGLQESTRGNGWYNGFNFDAYRDSGMDTRLTNEISVAAIRERLSCFGEHPGYGVRFYAGKFLSQWADGTYACRQATLATFGGRHSFFNELYAGKYSPAFISYCNAYQNILYLGVFLFCLMIQRKKIKPEVTGLPLYLCLIGVFGGFLFHMLWEANSRYIFPYSLLLMPYAAAGIEYAVSRMTERRQKCS